jgi:hypothetical protein
LFSNLELHWPLRFLLHHPAIDPALTLITREKIIDDNLSPCLGPCRPERFFQHS